MEATDVTLLHFKVARLYGVVVRGVRPWKEVVSRFLFGVLSGQSPDKWVEDATTAAVTAPLRVAGMILPCRQSSPPPLYQERRSYRQVPQTDGGPCCHIHQKTSPARGRCVSTHRCGVEVWMGTLLGQLSSQPWGLGTERCAGSGAGPLRWNGSRFVIG